jgi:hypothetical protein
MRVINIFIEAWLYGIAILAVCAVVLLSALPANANQFQGMLDDVLERQPIQWNFDRQFTVDDIKEALNQTPALNYKNDEIENFATPKELEYNSGDCEDIAIWRAYKLAEKGTGRLQLYLGNQGYTSHAVLVANGKWVLDNLKSYPYDIKHLNMEVIYKLEII